MAITLPALPYAPDALEPHMSAKTFDFHYGKHHKAYVDNLNKLIAGTPYENKSLEEIVTGSYGKPDQQGIFNNAAQVWNHTFFWNSMSPNASTTKPSGALQAAIDSAFGSVAEFKKQFMEAGKTQFGSGWAWLQYCPKHKSLEITKTANADTPFAKGLTPLLTCDVWEHAYYLDYQNRRPDFLQVFVDTLLNWDHANACFDSVAKQAAA